MLTAILPIHSKRNPFWSSSKGFECIKNRIESMSTIADIDRFVVITEDKRIQRLSKSHGMTSLDRTIPGSTDHPYTYAQSLTIAHKCQAYLKNQNDALLVVDHRNLLLGIKDVEKACCLYREYPQNGVIGLALCRDYPCQYKSYYTFMDCAIIDLYSPAKTSKVNHYRKQTKLGSVDCQYNSTGTISINVVFDQPNCKLSFFSDISFSSGYMAHFIPVDDHGPQYAQSLEIFISDTTQEVSIKTTIVDPERFIVALYMPAMSGEYDAVEMFTPPHAPWGLSSRGTTVADKRSREVLLGRQQFSPAYTYDGTLCILTKKQPSDPIPSILETSCIVTDWVDYWYAAAVLEPDER